MKSVYWRPKKISPSITFAIGMFAIVALALVELTPRFTETHTAEKQRANALATRCREQIRGERQKRGLAVNKIFDPTESGLVGTAMSPLTSKPADLEAKQLSLHPQFPAAVVTMLKQAGLKQGDTVAIGWTGSFPSLNVALAASIETLQLRPISICSLTASQYGANEPELTWLDMETSLHKSGMISFRSELATVGGAADNGTGLGKSSIRLVQASANRNATKLIRPKRLRASLKQRMRHINEQRGDQEIAAYINVGGGVASCGGGDCVFGSGLNSPGTPLTTGNGEPGSIPDCIMQRFSNQGIPVIHLARTKQLAKQFRLSPDNATWQTADLASSSVSPNRFLALTLFLVICVVLRSFILQDSGNRQVHAFFSRLRGRSPLRAVGQREGPQLMV